MNLLYTSIFNSCLSVFISNYYISFLSVQYIIQILESKDDFVFIKIFYSHTENMIK